MPGRTPQFSRAAAAALMTPASAERSTILHRHIALIPDDCVPLYQFAPTYDIEPFPPVGCMYSKVDTLPIHHRMYYKQTKLVGDIGNVAAIPRHPPSNPTPCSAPSLAKCEVKDLGGSTTLQEPRLGSARRISCRTQSLKQRPQPAKSERAIPRPPSAPTRLFAA